MSSGTVSGSSELEKKVIEKVVIGYIQDLMEKESSDDEILADLEDYKKVYPYLDTERIYQIASAKTAASKKFRLELIGSTSMDVEE